MNSHEQSSGLFPTCCFTAGYIRLELPMCNKFVNPYRWTILYVCLYCGLTVATEAGRWISLGTPVSSTHKTDRHDLTEIVLTVALSNLNPYRYIYTKFTPIRWPLQYNTILASTWERLYEFVMYVPTMVMNSTVFLPTRVTHSLLYTYLPPVYVVECMFICTLILFAERYTNTFLIGRHWTGNQCWQDQPEGRIPSWHWNVIVLIWTRICSVCCHHNSVLSSFMIHHQMCNRSETRGCHL